MQRGAPDSEDALGLCEDGPKQILLDPLDLFLPEQCSCLVVHSWACLGSEFPGRPLFIDGDHPHVSPQDLHYVFLLDRTQIPTVERPVFELPQWPLCEFSSTQTFPILSSWPTTFYVIDFSCLVEE